MKIKPIRRGNYFSVETVAPSRMDTPSAGSHTQPSTSPSSASGFGELPTHTRNSCQWLYCTPLLTHRHALFLSELHSNSELLDRITDRLWVTSQDNPCAVTELPARANPQQGAALRGQHRRRGRGQLPCLQPDVTRLPLLPRHKMASGLLSASLLRYALPLTSATPDTGRDRKFPLPAHH